MKNIRFAALLLSLLASCVAPINSSFESARMLAKGELEATGHYSRYNAVYEGESDAVNSNLGLRIGYGITDQFDLKVRYERLFPVEDDATALNYVDFAPKFQILKNNIAATLPIGVYFAENDEEFVLSPKFLFTYPVKDIFEATFATKADIFPEDEGNVYLGFNLGFGLSTNLNRWAVRPEIGVMIDPGESGSYWTFGIGIAGVLPGKN